MRKKNKGDLDWNSIFIAILLGLLIVGTMLFYTGYIIGYENGYKKAKQIHSN